MRKILVTGANGFVGRELCKRMLAEGWQVRAAVKSTKQISNLPFRVDALPIGIIGSDTDWSSKLSEISCVVHLAAHVHRIKGKIPDSLSLFRKINVAGTERLAREAASVNVRRFIYMSSVKVNGEGKSTPYTEEDVQKPQGAYGISKWEAEKVLKKISEETGMEVVILRSPLVYGPRVKANFLHLLKVVERGIPLPLANINNRRSLIYLGNLVDAIVACIKNPSASGQTYFVSDDEDVSTPELIRRMGSALGRPVRLFPFPSLILKIGGCISGNSVVIDRLVRSLMVDSSKIRHELNWKAPFSMEQGLRETARWYKKKDRCQESEV